MNASKLTAILWFGLLSQTFAQEHGQLEQLPLESPTIRVAENTAITTPMSMVLPARGSSSRRSSQSLSRVPESLTPSIDRPAQYMSARPNLMQAPGNPYSQDPTSFNASYRGSKLLYNPDQFWTNKLKPVVADNDNLFGDPNCACDEWRNLCGCCGLKTNPGHLGIKSLRGSDPCECVDDCCPAPRARGCQCEACR